MNIYLVTLFASLVGSLHCAGMCGPLAVSLHRKGHSLVFSTIYHLARLVSYLLICLFGLTIARGLDLSQFLIPLQNVSFYLASSVVLLVGVNSIFSGKISHFIPSSIRNLFTKIILVKNQSSLLYPANLGIATGLLPCGWLYSFIMASLMMKSYPQSLLLVFCFWLGTVPVLSSIEFVSKKPINFLRMNSPRIVGFSLILIALLVIYKRSNNPIEFCPHHDLHSSTITEK